jgi:hypothetical protein
MRLRETDVAGPPIGLTDPVPDDHKGLTADGRVGSLTIEYREAPTSALSLDTVEHMRLLIFFQSSKNSV